MPQLITVGQLEQFKAQLDAMYQHFLEHSDACEALDDHASNAGLNWALDARGMIADLVEHLSK